MITERYCFLREELVRLYRLFTLRTFNVTLPLASVLTTEQLKAYEKNPPIRGFNSLLTASERPYTVAFILQAVQVSGDQFDIGFSRPREDIPVIYEAIMKWIDHWIEIKIGHSYLRTPDIMELELIEKLGRMLFTPYSHYHHEKINQALHVPDIKNASLIDLLRGTMMFGKDFDQPISYYSALDEYKSSINYSSNSYGNVSLDFMQGFGGGL